MRELWNESGTFVIIECEAGTRFSNQTHGMACLHPETVGLLVELPDTEIPHVGCWGSDLSSEDVDSVNTAIQKWGLKVNQQRLDTGTRDLGENQDFGEAWLPVEGSMSGILTWRNCD